MMKRRENRFHEAIRTLRCVSDRADDRRAWVPPRPVSKHTRFCPKYPNQILSKISQHVGPTNGEFLTKNGEVKNGEVSHEQRAVVHKLAREKVVFVIGAFERQAAPGRRPTACERKQSVRDFPIGVDHGRITLCWGLLVP